MSDEMEFKEENLVKKICKELGITQKELAEKIGVTSHTITNWSKGRIDNVGKMALMGIIYKEKLIEFQNNLKNMTTFHFSY